MALYAGCHLVQDYLIEQAHFFDLLDLLVKATNHVVGAVRNLLDLHEADQGVNLGGQKQVESVAVIAQRHSGASRDFGNVNVLMKVHNILALWMHLDKDLVFAHDL